MILIAVETSRFIGMGSVAELHACSGAVQRVEQAVVGAAAAAIAGFGFGNYGRLQRHGQSRIGGVVLVGRFF